MACFLYANPSDRSPEQMSPQVVITEYGKFNVPQERDISSNKKETQISQEQILNKT